MAQRVVSIVVAVGTPRTGLWCSTCALPAAIEMDVWVLTRAGLRLLGVQTLCAEANHGAR